MRRGRTPSWSAYHDTRSSILRRASRFSQSSSRREECTGPPSTRIVGRAASRSIQTGARRPSPERITYSTPRNIIVDPSSRCTGSGIVASLPAIQSFSLRAKSSARSSERVDGATTDTWPVEGSTFTMKRRARGLVRRITSTDLPSILRSSRLMRRDPSPVNFFSTLISQSP